MFVRNRQYTYFSRFQCCDHDESCPYCYVEESFLVLQNFSEAPLRFYIRRGLTVCVVCDRRSLWRRCGAAAAAGTAPTTTKTSDCHAARPLRHPPTRLKRSVYSLTPSYFLLNLASAADTLAHKYGWSKKFC